MYKWAWLFLFILVLNPTYAQSLTAQEAFKINAKLLDSSTITLHWQIKPGYFLYAKRIKIAPTAVNKINMAPVAWPTPTILLSNFNKAQAVYSNFLTIPLKIRATHAGLTKIKITFQGCAQKGYCYPPQIHWLSLMVDNNLHLTAAKLIANNQINNISSNRQELFGVWGLVSFFALGFILAFSPCNLPLLPILSSILVGQQKHLSTIKALCISLSYVAGLALSYAIAGAIAASFGHNIQASLQSPWVIGAFSLFFLWLAGSLFGFYEFNFSFARLTPISNIYGKPYLNAALLGAVSMLVLTPCVTTPFIAALTYIMQSGNIVAGSLKLFVLGIGIGTPLIIMGTSLGKYLPKAGRWTRWINIFFGLLLLGIALSLLLRLQSQDTFSTTVSIRKISTVREVKQAISASQGHPVILEFYANWCSSCKIMEARLFKDPETSTALRQQGVIFLKADITDLTDNNATLLKNFKVVAPPTFLFFDQEGREVKELRVAGTISATRFLQLLAKAVSEHD